VAEPENLRQGAFFLMNKKIKLIKNIKILKKKKIDYFSTF
jgi:hypothetical protein